MAGRRSKKAVRFSHAWINGLPRPAVRQEWSDRDCDCLSLRIGPSGSKSFYFFGRLHGELKRMRLGEYPKMPLAQARREVARMLGEAAIGKTPKPRAMEKRDELAAELTLGDLWDWYLRTHAKPHKRTWDDDLARYNRVLSHWGSRRLSTITTEEVKDLHVRLNVKGTKRDKHGHLPGGPYAANKMLELLGFMWRLGQSQLKISAPDPTQGIKRFEATARERFLSRSELPRFFDALQAWPKEATRDFIMMALLTGARRSNIAAMRWDELDLEERIWSIPPTKSKNKSPMRIVLAAPALLILERRREGPRSPWVFPGGGKTGHLVEPKRAMAAIKRKANLGDLRLHDLRRTLGSWQAALGTSLPIIGKSLGQESLQSTKIYARLNLEPVFDSVDAATARMLDVHKQAIPSGND